MALWPVLRTLAGLLLAGLLLGALLGQPLLGLALGLALALGWQLRQLQRLQRWLNAAEGSAVPEARGVWGELFDGLHHRQRRARQEQQRLLDVLLRVQRSTDALRDGVVLLDDQGCLDWWNPAAERLLGLKSPQDRGQPLGNLLRHPRFKRYFEAGQYQEPLELASPVDEQLHLQLQITRYGDNERLLLARDMTRLHRLEQMRKDFVANLSHELRTPLTVIGGYLETLLDNAAQATPLWRRALQQMHGQAGRMQHLLDDLLLLARLETSELPSERQQVDVPALLELIIADARALSAARGHRISLQLDSRAMLHGNPGELRSAFSNLLFNAVKYSPDGSAIEVRWQQRNGQLCCSVSDQGCGIERQHLPRLTERFYRVDASRSTDSGGTGLGLAIVKHVLLRHQGRLEIDSQPGRGSTFSCLFNQSAD